ncbi:MAG: hypothetical protein R6X25_02720 [Candidatus Krumholzibacteriia bacterium]
MLRIATAALLTGLLLAAGGCSVFGIATEDDLEEAMRRKEAQQRVLEDRVDALETRIASARTAIEDLEGSLQPRLAELDTRLGDVDDRVATTTAEWNVLREVLTVGMDTLRSEFDEVTAEVTSVRGDIDLATQEARRARSRSQEAMRVHYENLVAERDHLALRLQDLEAKLQEFPTLEAAESDGIAGQDSAEVRPAGDGRAARETAAAIVEPAGQEEPGKGKVEIRVVTPEERERGREERRR